MGDAKDPLLVSVRSGAAASLPGMMDTVLNLGMNDEAVKGLADVSGSERFAWDAYRRFIQMFSDVVKGTSIEPYEHAIEAMKKKKGVEEDTDLDTGPREADRRVQSDLPEGDGRTVSAGSGEADVGCDWRGVRQLEQSQSGYLSPYQRHQGTDRYRCQYRFDGIWKPR